MMTGMTTVQRDPEVARQPRAQSQDSVGNPPEPGWVKKQTKTVKEQYVNKLLPQDWNVPCAVEMQYNTDGVYLPPSQQEAETMIARLGNPQKMVAVLSLKPVAAAKSSKQLSFRVMTTTNNGRVYERLLTGYLNQLGPHPVQYKDSSLLAPKLADSQTSVRIHLKSDAKFLTEKQWESIRRVSDKRSLSALVQPHNLTVIDAWDGKTCDGAWTIAARVKKGDLDRWMNIKEAFCVAVAGELALQHRVIWDGDAKTLDSARLRYSKVPGFTGLVLGRSGLGARIELGHHNAALEFLGRPGGDLFEVRGLPLGATQEMLEELLNNLSWEIKLLDGYRKISRGQAIFRGRALQPPPADLIRTSLENEVLHLQIAKVHPRSQPPQSSERPRSQPASWSEAARRAIGVQRDYDDDDHAVPEQSYTPEPDEMDDEMFDEQDLAADDELPSSRSKWSRRLPEPSPKIRRVEDDAKQMNHDPRVDALVDQMAEVMRLIQSMAQAQQASSLSH